MMEPLETIARRAGSLLAALAFANPCLPPAQAAEADAPQPQILSSGISEAVIARVNGVPLLLSELREMALDLDVPPSALLSGGLTGEAFRRAVTALIDETLLLHEAKLEELETDELDLARRVDKSIRRLVRRLGGEEEFAHFLRRSQLTLASLRDVMTERERRKVLTARIVARRVTVSTTDVEDFRRRLLAEGKSTEEVRLLQIFIRSPRDEQGKASGRQQLQRAIDIATQAGQSVEAFQELARRASDDPGGRAASGAVGWNDPQQLKPEIRTRIAEMRPGETSEPIASDEGYHVLRLAARHTTRDLLYAERWEKERTKLLETLRERMDIEYYGLGDESPPL